MLKSLKYNTFLAGSAVYLISNILNAFIPFALLPILTRNLSPEEYGQVAMFQTLIGALTAFVGFSAAGAAGRKFFDSELGKNDLAEFIGACLQILFASSLLCAAVLLIFNSQFSVWLGLEKKWLYGALIVTAANVIIQLRLGQWQVRNEPFKYGGLQITRSLLDFCLSLGLLLLLLKGVDGRINAQVWSASIFALLSLWLLKHTNLISIFSWRPQFIKEALQFGVPLIPHVAGGFLLSSVDRFVINSELGLAQAGIYMVAVQFSMALALVFDSVNKAYVPWLFERLKKNDENEKRQIVRFTYAWYVLILCSVSLAFTIGPWLIIVVAGENYEAAGDVIGWLILGQVFGGMYLMVTNYIFFSKRTGLLSLVTISSGIINLVLLFLLIVPFGLKGAAYAFCVAMGIRFLLTWMVAQKRHPMPWFNFVKKNQVEK